MQIMIEEGWISHSSVESQDSKKTGNKKLLVNFVSNCFPISRLGGSGEEKKCNWLQMVMSASPSLYSAVRSGFGAKWRELELGRVEGEEM